MNKLVLELVADSNNLLKSMEQAQRSVNNFIRGSESAGEALGGGVNRALESFKGLASGGAVAAGVMAGALTAVTVAATAMTLEAGRQAEALTQLSAITGIGSQTLQQYDVLLNRVGLGGEDLSLVMKTLSQKMEAAKSGTGDAADRFRQLGIDITKVTSTDDLIRKVAESVSHFTNGTEKAAIMADLLGKSGLKFIPAFEGGAKAIDAAAAASERIGASLSGTQLAALGSMDDAVDDLGLAWKRFGQQLGAVVAPAVDMVAHGLMVLLSIGSHTFHALDTAADTLAIRLTHMGLAMIELGSVIFTEKTFEQAWSNIKLINEEAAKLIAKRRELASMGAADDSRGHAPALVDSAKVAARAQADADAQLKFSEQLFKNQETLAQARLQNLQARLEAEKALNLSTDLDVARSHEAAIEQMSAFESASLETQIRNYSRFYQMKSRLFGSDEKGQADKAKFEMESSQKSIELLNQLEVAHVRADTARTQSALRTAQAIRAAQLQPYEDAVVKIKAWDEAQQALYRTEAGLLGASDAARRVRMTLIDAEAERDRVRIEQTIADETRKAEAIQTLELQTDTKRRQAIQQFPSFFEQQMQALVNSNSFSMGQMVSTWSGGIAQMVVHGGNLKAAWEQTQVALVQAALNSGISFLANMALSLSQELGLVTSSEAAKAAAMATSREAELAAHVGLEAAKTAITETQDAARMVLAVGSAKAMDTLMVASLGSMSVMATAALAMAFAVSQVVAGIAYGAAAIMAATPFGQPAAGALIVAATGFEFATGAAIIAAQGAIQGILGTAIVASAKPFASGGIVTGATLGLMGEAGPEAAIPLNSRGASFMSDMLGMGGGGGEQKIFVLLDGRTIGEAVANRMMERVYVEVGA